MKWCRTSSGFVIFTLFLLTTTLNRAEADSAQQEITVPELIGLAVPQAARIAGEAGLRFDSETEQPWDQTANVQPNQVIGQEPAAGVKTSPGTPIKVTVLRLYNVALIFGETVLTITN